MNIYELRQHMKECCELMYENVDSIDDLGKKNLFVLSHCLDRGGAPLVLLELIPYFKKRYNIIFVSIKDGELKQEFINAGVNVYIGDYNVFWKCGRLFWTSFDAAFLNTIVSYNFIRFFNGTNVPTMWWLHEPEMLFKSSYGIIPHMGEISKNIKILSVTDETARCVKNYYGVDSCVLHMGLEDMYAGDRTRTDGKVRFFMPAKFQRIKGQDIIARAIMELPAEYMAKTEFVFAGNQDETQPDWYELIKKLSETLDNVTMLGTISKKDVYEWYQNVDCVIAPSRADATPTTIVEAMMFRKVCLCSDATGISKYMTDGKNGYIHESENIESLVKKIIYIIDNIDDMEEIRNNGREIYLQEFERRQIEEKLDNLMSAEREKRKLVEKSPKVSVILPAYNHENFIEETIESVLNQTFQDFEFIIGDDASTDGTVEKILKYQDEIEQIHLFDFNDYGHMPFLKEQASGEYIAIINSDDVWMPSKLEKQVKILDENPDVVACFTWCDRIDENSVLLNGANPFCANNRTKEEWLNYFFFQGNCFAHASLLIRRELYMQMGKKNASMYRQIPDFNRWIEVIQEHEVYMIEEKLTKIRTNTGEGRSNVSACNRDNLIRQMNEESYMWYKVIGNMDEQYFLKAFREQLIDVEATEPIHIMCEKFFVLLQTKLEFAKIAAIFYYYDHYDEIKEWLLERYQFSYKDMYELQTQVGLGKMIK